MITATNENKQRRPATVAGEKRIQFDLDQEIWRRVKVAAAQAGQTLKEWIATALDRESAKAAKKA